MTTWTVTGSGTRTYAGPAGVGVIDIATDGDSVLSIGIADLHYFSVGERGRIYDTEIRGSAHHESLTLEALTLASVNLSGITRDADFGPGDALWIAGGKASQTFVGTGGDDYLHPGGGKDSVDGGAGKDTLSFQDETGPFAYRLTDGTFLTNGAGSSISFRNIEALDLTLGQGRDSVIGLAGGDRIEAGGLDDRLNGAGGADVLLGQGGDDDLEGAKGGDSLFGGDGNDVLHGDEGADSLYGGTGRDALQGGSGNDLLVGETGGDGLYGGAGSDTYLVRSAGVRIFEAQDDGSDLVNSTVSFDLANSGGSGAGEIEVLVLQGGNLNGFGNAADNLIQGTTGANFLQGRGGTDLIARPEDSATDIVRFRAVSDSAGVLCDRIDGFDANGEDRLDILVGGADVDSLVLRSGGALSATDFAADTAARLDATFTAGGGVQAVLWNPDDGGLNGPGVRFLVVDLNDSGSYEEAKDLVIQFRNLSGTLDIGDFL